MEIRVQKVRNGDIKWTMFSLVDIQDVKYIHERESYILVSGHSIRQRKQRCNRCEVGGNGDAKGAKSGINKM